MKNIIIAFVSVFIFSNLFAQTQIWEKHEIIFESSKTYDNPIYEVKDFKIFFTAPSGRTKTVRGFWDGGTDWKVRFLPDETGEWNWETECSDKENSGLNNQSGKFECVPNETKENIFQKGVIQHEPGKYYLSYSDGTPFFWLACTAWNGALKSTDEDWEHYLNQRKENNYNVIQLVTTEWRGCDKNPEGLTAIDGAGYIRIHPEFFKRIDHKIDEVNAKGLVVSPVVLWALPKGEGRHLSPGYTLPLEEAVLLAKYIVARYQGNQVVWTLGGDGRYFDEQEVKWKEIGRRVFNDIDHAPVTLHPHGSSWVGDIYDQEDWYNLMGYQSSHNNGERVVNWINKGPMSQMWSKLKPMPYINMEPNYEEIGFRITAKDVRNASYWSIFATPLAGVTYGANGVWPWLAEGEKILNHNDKGGVTGWRKSIEFPGSIQMGYLGEFIQKFDWWNLYPANEILANQPGEEKYNHWISVVKSSDDKTIIAYIPENCDVKLFNPKGMKYSAQWFNPVTNEYSEAEIEQRILTKHEKIDFSKGERMMVTVAEDSKTIEFGHNFENDMLIVLKKK
ncbi:MAG: DUF4038 domain-containing protein [Prolixibacteraceae bacterium]|jgi:hypothetical protein|nr:DUF4038 domain-containing protein [Prolixibacteraceae bacterium]MBT6998398.1 DUF4038 domain-containing protein [Prolixibacteraceae bacterium]MBT7397403.1 DUF4038 domain-containing protein [Prolixibacteraceae bacterium]